MQKKRTVIHLPNVIEKIHDHPWSFLGVFLIIFFVSHTFLASVDFAPTGFNLYTPGRTITQIPTPDTVAVAHGEEPTRIEIPAVGIKANVSNPQSTDIKALDQALLVGAVRYPGTGLPGEKGNALLFGHSSHLPVVHNQAYKAFNDIQKLTEGDDIYVYGETKVYTYAVERVEQKSAATDAIPLSTDGAELTLATCDNFGHKSDRWIVTAKLVAVASLEETR